MGREQRKKFIKEVAIRELGSKLIAKVDGWAGCDLNTPSQVKIKGGQCGKPDGRKIKWEE
jgi:hypothetical protein